MRQALVLICVPRGPSVFNSIATAGALLGKAGGGGGGAALTGIETGALKPLLAPIGIPMI